MSCKCLAKEVGENNTKIPRAMKATVSLNLSDYMAIARMVADCATDEPSTYEVEYNSGGYVLYLYIEHDFDTREVRGGSYENYDFERLTEVYNEGYDIISYECLDSDGEPISCDFTSKRLLDILN